MTTFKIWKDGDTNAYYESEEGDTIETLGAKERIETYVVTSIHESKLGEDYRTVRANIIKKDGSIGKKNMKIRKEYCEPILGLAIETTIHTKS